MVNYSWKRFLLFLGIGIVLSFIIVIFTPAKYEVSSLYEIKNDDEEKTVADIKGWVYSTELLVRLQYEDVNIASVLPRQESKRLKEWADMVSVKREENGLRVSVVFSNLENAVRFSRFITQTLEEELDLNVLEGDVIASGLASPKAYIIFPSCILGVLMLSFLVSKVYYERVERLKKLKEATPTVHQEYDHKIQEWIRSGKVD